MSFTADESLGLVGSAKPLAQFAGDGPGAQAGVIRDDHIERDGERRYDVGRGATPMTVSGTVTCELCGKRVKRNAWKQKFCSTRCRIRAWSNQSPPQPLPAQRKCPICGKTFKPRTAWQVYDLPRCLVRANNLRKRATPERAEHQRAQARERQRRYRTEALFTKTQKAGATKSQLRQLRTLSRAQELAETHYQAAVDSRLGAGSLRQYQARRLAARKKYQGLTRALRWLWRYQTEARYASRSGATKSQLRQLEALWLALERADKDYRAAADRLTGDKLRQCQARRETVWKKYRRFAQMLKRSSSR